jgi:hypothetical protein
MSGGYGSSSFGAMPYGSADAEHVVVSTSESQSDSESDSHLSAGYGSGSFGAMPYGSAEAETIVSDWSPFIGSVIRRADAVNFSVTNDAYPLLDVNVAMVFSSGEIETVWAGGRFAETYRRGSARVPLANGFHYIVRRTGGWSGAVIGFDVKAADLASSESSGQSL